MAPRRQPVSALDLRLRLSALLFVIAHSVLPPACLAAPPPEHSPAGEAAKLLAFLEQPDGQFTHFAAALKRTEVPSLLRESLANGTRFTLLAPTDSAFARLAAEHPRLCADADSRLTVAATHFVGGRFPFSRIALKAPGFEFRTEGVDLVRLPDAPLEQGKRRVLLAVKDAPLASPAGAGKSDLGVVVGQGSAAAESAKELAARAHVVRPNALISRRIVVHGIDAVLAPNYVLDCQH
ncbi:unnamed protein product [Closterium sp. Naga37s-1]|nr:unnamed protein product [Closterium sp. Naga37s-1]